MVVVVKFLSLYFFKSIMDIILKLVIIFMPILGALFWIVLVCCCCGGGVGGGGSGGGGGGVVVVVVVVKFLSIY